MTRHAVYFLCYNNLHLTKRALATVAAQDIGELDLLIVNNDSTDGTAEWLSDFATFVSDSHKVQIVTLSTNQSPVKVTNMMLEQVFKHHDRVLMVPNDVYLPPNIYRLMDEWPRGIIAASPTKERNFPEFTVASAVSENTPMSLLLIRRWFYDALRARDGYFFDEQFTHYGSDCDMALRLCSCGVHGLQLDVQYWHHESATLRLAPPDVKRRMEKEADEDRRKFVAKWGFLVDSLEYGQAATNINWRGKSLVQEEKICTEK